MKVKIIFTCEHGGNQIPAFVGEKNILPKKLLNSHVGWDIGALDVVHCLQNSLRAKIFYNEVTRLLIDYNRNPSTCLKTWTRSSVDSQVCKQLLKQYHQYRRNIVQYVHECSLKYDQVLIFSIHSFTPIFKNKTRSTDIGLLFRTNHKDEVELANQIRHGIVKNQDRLGLAVHFNRPYRGHTDCFLNDLLDQFIKNKKVSGLFIELNQKLLKNKSLQSQVCRHLSTSIKNVSNSFLVPIK